MGKRSVAGEHPGGRTMTISSQPPLTPEPEAVLKEPLRREPLPLIWAVGLYLLCLLLMVSAGVLLQTADLRIGLIVTEVALILAPTLWFAHRSRRPFRQVLHLRPVGIPVMVMALLITVPLRVCSFLVSAIVQTVLPMPDFILDSLRSMYAELMFPSSAVELVLSFLAVVLLAGVCEEIMFRGFILHVFLNRKGRWFAIVSTGLGFALFHLDPWAFPEIVVIGIFLGWLVVRTGSIFPSMMAHASFNFLGIFALPRAFGVETIDDFLAISFPAYLYPVAFIAMVALLYLLVRMTAGKAEANGSDVQEPYA